MRDRDDLEGSAQNRTESGGEFSPAIYSMTFP